jgi:ankyrin repeat protein
MRRSDGDAVGAFFEAVRAGDAARVAELVRGGPELLGARGGPAWDSARPTACTGLHVAVHVGSVAVAEVLLDAGIDVEARTTEGRTALHDAIELSSKVEPLLHERGAFVDVCSAAILGRLDRLRELLDADPTLVDDRSTNLSPLGWASYGNAVESARLLIERGARMDDHELCCAASVGHVEVGRMLLRHGADRALRDGRGRTAHDVAEQRAGLQHGEGAGAGRARYEAVAVLLASDS